MSQESKNTAENRSETSEKTAKNRDKTSKKSQKKLRFELDHSAKFYPIMSTKKAQSLFRISAIMTEEVDKDKAAGWPDERLELVGLKRQTSDAFFIEIKRDAVPEQTA